MGDARHKKSPPEDAEEDVTPEFRKRARAIMQANKITNGLHGWKPGHPEYLIEDDVDLAVVVIGNKDGKTQIGNLLGPVRPTSKPRNLIDRSAFVQKIRRALKMDDPVTIKVEPQRADIVRWISGLPDDQFEVFVNAYNTAVRKQR